MYVVDEPIPAGTPGEAVSEYIRVDTMLQRNLAGDNVSDLTELDGLVAASEILPGERHMMSLTAPALVNARLRAFVEEVT